MIDFQSFVESLKDKKFAPAPAYLFSGANAYLKSRATALLAERMASAQPAFVRMTIEEITEQALAVELATIPLFGGLRVVHLDTRVKQPKKSTEAKKPEDAEESEEPEEEEPTQAEKTIPPEMAEVLRRYLKNPSPFTLLLLTGRSAKEFGLDGIKNVTIVKCDDPKPDQVPAFVKSISTAKGKEIAPAAIQELIRRCRQGDVGTIAANVDKLAAYVGRRKAITAQDVAQVVVRDVDFSTLDMLREISAANAGAAIDMLRVMLQRNVPPQFILGGIAASYRRLLEAKFLFQSGIDHATIGTRLGIRPDKVGGFASVVRRYSVEELKTRHREILKTDLLMKTSREKGEVLLENLVLRLCRPAP